MTNEEKQLLLIDLCARLPYDPFIKIGNNPNLFKLSTRLNWIVLYGINGTIEEAITDNQSICKPYLRPMLSMTEEEMDTLFDILHIDKEGKDEDWIKINDVMGIKFFLPTGRWMEEMDKALQYLRKIHIDIYDFIRKGIALEAPKNMYK